MELCLNCDGPLTLRAVLMPSLYQEGWIILVGSGGISVFSCLFIFFFPS